MLGFILQIRYIMQSPSEVWEDIKLDYVNKNISIKSRFFDSDIYMVLTAPIKIAGNRIYITDS